MRSTLIRLPMLWWPFGLKIEDSTLDVFRKLHFQCFGSEIIGNPDFEKWYSNENSITLRCFIGRAPRNELKGKSLELKALKLMILGSAGAAPGSFSRVHSTRSRGLWEVVQGLPGTK